MIQVSLGEIAALVAVILGAGAVFGWAIGYGRKEEKNNATASAVARLQNAVDALAEKVAALSIRVAELNGRLTDVEPTSRHRPLGPDGRQR